VTGVQTPEGAEAEADATTARPKRVVYLLGAGATQGATDFAGSDASLIMRGLMKRLLDGMHDEYVQHFVDHKGMTNLVNDVVNDDTDFEHLITFIEDAPSGSLKEFAARLKTLFFEVLSDSLKKVRDELGQDHSKLFALLVDMHRVDGSNESLSGFLTLNYDSFLEHAIETSGGTVDYGVAVHPDERDGDSIPVLKLHGSFSWRDTWPLATSNDLESSRWIPPGIRKAKAEYPFNAIWGAARDLLDCDVLRIIGCNLSPNDWDLVSLLFTTMHGREAAGPFAIEVIGRPRNAKRISANLPYLEVNSILELDEVGDQFVAEVLGRGPTRLSALDDSEIETAISNADEKIDNPFERWLRLKGELMHRDLPSLETPLGLFRDFVEAGG
jgi:hypothetical protein